VIFTWGISQVTIAPTSIFINEKEPFGTLLIMNGTDKTQEVTVSFPFGYPESDSTGLIKMNFSSSSELAQKYSIENSVSGFPRSFTIAPNKRQVVRLTVRPKAATDPGTYWTRIRTASSEIAAEVGEKPKEGITAEIRFVFEQITTFFYQTGDLNTGLSITKIHNKIVENNITFITDFNKSGNSPYLGTMKIKIYDSNEVEVKSNQIYISVYNDGSRNLNVDLDGLSPGPYSATITFISKRDDIPDRYNIVTEPITRRINFIY